MMWAMVTSDTRQRERVCVPLIVAMIVVAADEFTAAGDIRH